VKINFAEGANTHLFLCFTAISSHVKFLDMMHPIWGIDLGGTKIEGVVLESRESQRVLAKTRVETGAHLGYDHIIEQIGKLLDLLSAETGLKPQKVGLGHPGALDPDTQTMKNANTTCLNGRRFKADLEARFGIVFLLANDANCFAVAEAKFGIVADIMPEAKVVFGVIMGTGVGGGIVVNGEVIHGRHGIGGEWGHNFLDSSGGKCYCGQIGCVETIISGPALQRFYAYISDQTLSLKEIVEKAKTGEDQYAMVTMDRLVHFFGKSIAVLINILDPDVIVIGGGVGNIDILYTRGIEEVEKYIFNNKMKTRIVKPKLGDSAGVYGAALL
jgi:fructokinase